MIKQTLTWTALPHKSDGPLAAGTELRLSVYVAPRLWNDDASVTSMPLGDFPDWLDWPAVIAGTTFQVEFDGGPTLPAVPENVDLRSDLWQALFKTTTSVRPFLFEDLSAATLVSFSATAVHGSLKAVYQRAGTDPALGGGSDLPDRAVLALDPGMVDAARPVEPAPPWEPPETDRGPVHVGGDEEPPDEEPGPGEPGGPELPGGPDGIPEELKGCPPSCVGCLLWPLRAFAKLIGMDLPAGWEVPPSSSTAGSGSSGSGSSPAPGPAPAPGPGPAPSPGPGPAPGPAPAPALPPQPPQSPVYADLHAFAQPTSPISAALPTASQVEDEFDFHQMISSLGDTPELMRRLGLVVDLVVTLDATLPAGTGTVRVVPTAPLSMAAAHASPRTHYELGAERFLAAARGGSDLDNGLLRLSDPTRFQVLQTDVMGGGLKLQNTATNVRGMERLSAWPANSPKEVGLPALQTAGVSVARAELVPELTRRIDHAFALNLSLAAIDLSAVAPYAGTSAPPAPSDELFADDLVRGYRIDVFDTKTAAWHSLCRRVGSYEFLDGPLSLAGVEDEGFVQLATVEPIERGADRELRVHESLFTWDGWSLVAPRPGSTLLPDHSIGETPNTAATQFQLETAFRAVAGSLPRLRFGSRYRLRARAVDLAGNSVLAPADAAFQDTQPEATDEFPFGRFEPVPPPPLVLRSLPIEGESLERLVVRSSIHDSAAAIESQTGERHVVPPKTSQLMTERHRFFDGVPAMADDQAAYDLASREAGSLTHRMNPATGTLELIPGTLEDEVSPGRTYWLQPNDTFEVAFLPDPFARGVVLQGLPGLAAPGDVTVGVNKLEFGGTWPDALPMRLRIMGLEAGAAPALPAWDPVTHVLTVQVPQGETASVRISCYFDAADLVQLGVWHWLRETGSPDLPALENEALDGRSWLLSPFRELVLVHAVQEPLEIPALSTAAIAPARAVGETSVQLEGDVTIDAKSTGELDLRAAWTDPHDDLAKPSYDAALDVRRSEMHVETLQVHDAANDMFSFSAVAHSLGDTKYHRVTYTPIATTRYREYFPPAVLATPEGLIRPTPAEVGTPPADAARFELDVPNAARPSAVAPLYAVPAFSWTRTEAGGVVTRERRGGGIRLYMERPWFSSGAGELLGLVLRPSKYGALSEDWKTLRQFTSEWGMDPIWSASETAPLARTDFVNVVGDDTELTLAELDNLEVDVVGFRAEYDTERDLWYSDIQIAAERHYFPFVRMALARFQPISVDGAHLSRVVLSDFVQLLPHRRVEYDLNQVGGTGEVPIQVRGPAWVRGVRQSLQSPVVIARVERRQYETGDELGWTVLSSTVLTPTQQDRAETIWEGRVQLPTPAPGPLRILVLELETYAAEKSDDRVRTDRLRELVLDDGTSRDDPTGRDVVAGVLPAVDLSDSDDRAPTLPQAVGGHDFRVVFADSLEVAP